MLKWVRSAAYLGATATVWFAEGLVFSRALGFNLAQTAIVFAYFAALLGLAAWLAAQVWSRMRSDPRPTDLPLSPLLAAVPVMVLVVGSFAALPVFIVLLIAGAAHR